MKILTISSPGGDRGPAIGYKNHLSALRSGGIDIVDINQDIWNSSSKMKAFDVAWAYVRFNQIIYDRCMELGIPIIGGPNIALERADLGISDAWERWYLTRSGVSINLNVADYYSDHVRKFVTSNMSCKTLEYCYESNDVLSASRSEDQVDVLIYEKDRVNDGKSSSRVVALQLELNRAGLSHRTVVYGSHTREEYIKECLGARVCAWLSIEDYCSLAQIESHLAGCCVVGTQYNLTIPTIRDCLVDDAQYTDNWITWSDDETVARAYVNSIQKVISTPALDKATRDAAKLRHSYDYYCKRSTQLIQEVL